MNCISSNLLSLRTELKCTDRSDNNINVFVIIGSERPQNFKFVILILEIFENYLIVHRSVLIKNKQKNPHFPIDKT